MTEVGTIPRHRVRVMTWNVQGGKRTDVRGLARAVADADPDVLALQEVRRGQARSIADLLDVPEMRWLVKHSPLGRLGARWSEGLAVLSRFPVRAYESAVLSSDEPMRTFRRRVLQDLVVATAGGPVRVVNTHLSSHDDHARADQAERAVQILSVPSIGICMDRGVLMGDLNTTDAPEVMGRLLDLGLVDAWASRNPGTVSRSGATNPAQAPTQRLDHVLVGECFDVVGVRVPEPDASWVALSDHLPVVADLLLPSAR